MENFEGYCICGRPLAPRRRKYCAPCARKVARLARILWKREYRALNRGTRAHLDPWRNRTESEAAAREAYNAFMREYMRRYRRLHRLESRLSHEPQNRAVEGSSRSVISGAM